MVLQMIEDYCQDYYNDSVLKDVNMKQELQDSVFHFIPLVNPDGHDIVKFGSTAKVNKDMKILLTKYDHKTLKANANGVDLNRNYPDWYFDGEKWVDIWNKMPGDNKYTAISSEMYLGPSAGSESEIQAVSAYALRYDFRVVLSYHSQGRILYYNRSQFDDTYNNLSKQYAQVISKVTGYRISNPADDTSLPTSGYFSHYVNGLTYKPFVTIETTNCKQPSTKEYFQTEYSKYKLYMPPIAVLRLARSKGYYDYKIYKDGKYVQDVHDKTYGEAIAARIGGELLEYKGKPSLYRAEKMGPYVLWDKALKSISK